LIFRLLPRRQKEGKKRRCPDWFRAKERTMKKILLPLAILAFLAGPLRSPLLEAQEYSLQLTVQIEELPLLDVPYVPTPADVVQRMLDMGGVNSRDILYDLGCGDGRVVIAAAKQFHARSAIGVDIDPRRIQESGANARQAGVFDRVRFHRKDLFSMDLEDATVVTLYLLPSVNLKLRPKLLRDLKPGTRILSHDFDMGDWRADRQMQVREHMIYFWIVPANMNGTWKWVLSDGGQTHHYVLEVRQQFQELSHTELRIDGALQEAGSLRLSGNRLEFTAPGVLFGRTQQLQFSGIVQGRSMHGSVSTLQKAEGTRKWVAEREQGTPVPVDAESASRIEL
jgi:SAM-dependent methyltransferase